MKVMKRLEVSFSMLNGSLKWPTLTLPMGVFIPM